MSTARRSRMASLLHVRRPYIALAMLLTVWLGGAVAAHAAGARFISGAGWGPYPTMNVVWNRTVLPYFTDPGDLSRSVPHTQADAMVAAAAAVWNVPTSNITLAQGGELAEDVSAANTYFDGTQLIFPADVQTANEGNVPVAIIYDVNGELIDLLLGSGASEPDGCRQNAVVGDVDDLHQWDSTIGHATLILNGRCVGSTPEQMTEMQYQLARAFGRVLGLSWSQTNDNVFTAESTITANQMAYWPLMHPIDVICGNYAYQCMQNPFTLRVDDLNALADLYPVPIGSGGPGKQGSDVDALWFRGVLYFPTGQGMDWVNVTARRQHAGVMEDWQMTSSITGFQYQQAVGTPIDPTPAANSGVWVGPYDGFFNFRRIPLDGGANVFLTTEPINPLYTGDYAVGPYIRTPATPSGSTVTIVDWSAQSAGDWPISGDMTAGDASTNCNPGADGTESAPAAPDSSGWQNGLFCGFGHSSWWGLSVAAGHSWTLEVTATDERGSASVTKAAPVLGVWNGSDATGTTPTVASQAVPFNSMSLGMTQMQMPAPDSDNTYRIAVVDQYGAGRPDFTYTARFLYAASVTPATVGSGGGRIVITGTGFKQGNQVLVNGAAARVVSWSATQIVAVAPTMNGAGTQVGVPVPIAVTDASTGGTASITGALSYTAEPNVLQLVSAPGTLETGIVASVPFAVKVLASDGVTPVANETVQLATISGSAQLDVCGTAASCTVTTDAQGVVQTAVTGGAPNSSTLQAKDVSDGSALQLTLKGKAPVRVVAFATMEHYVATGFSGSWTPTLVAQQDGSPAMGVPVTFTASAGLGGSVTTVPTDRNGSVGVQVSAAGVESGLVGSVSGCAWPEQICATWNLYAVDVSQWRVAVTGGAGQTVAQGSALSPVMLAVTDGAGHALEGAPVQLYQRVLAWEGVCAGLERCPSAPVLATSQATLTSDANGAIEIAPLEVPGVPQVVQIAATTGTQGFVTLTLVKSP